MGAGKKPIWPAPASERAVVASMAVIMPKVEMLEPTRTRCASQFPPSAWPTLTQKPLSHCDHLRPFSAGTLAPTSTGGTYVATPATTSSSRARGTTRFGFRTSSVTLPAESKPLKFQHTTGRKSSQFTFSGMSLMRSQSKPCGSCRPSMRMKGAIVAHMMKMETPPTNSTPIMFTSAVTQMKMTLSVFVSTPSSANTVLQ
mmetsp:Transcript_41302/g.127607  ORF Transcript_41302/g.127607 Transcript_41302/m.127607 type:complete len:200 (+) Transcript_41302:650-1249(+)